MTETQVNELPIGSLVSNPRTGLCYVVTERRETRIFMFLLKDLEFWEPAHWGTIFACPAHEFWREIVRVA